MVAERSPARIRFTRESTALASANSLATAKIKPPLPPAGSQSVSADDDVIDHDIILVWADEKRIITGAYILGRFMRGIAKRERKDQGSVIGT